MASPEIQKNQPVQLSGSAFVSTSLPLEGRLAKIAHCLQDIASLAVCVNQLPAIEKSIVRWGTKNIDIADRLCKVKKGHAEELVRLAEDRTLTLLDRVVRSYRSKADNFLQDIRATDPRLVDSIAPELARKREEVDQAVELFKQELSSSDENPLTPKAVTNILQNSGNRLLNNLLSEANILREAGRSLVVARISRLLSEFEVPNCATPEQQASHFSEASGKCELVGRNQNEYQLEHGFDEFFLKVVDSVNSPGFPSGLEGKLLDTALNGLARYAAISGQVGPLIDHLNNQSSASAACRALGLFGVYSNSGQSTQECSVPPRVSAQEIAKARGQALDSLLSHFDGILVELRECEGQLTHEHSNKNARRFQELKTLFCLDLANCGRFGIDSIGPLVGSELNSRQIDGARWSKPFCQVIFFVFKQAEELGELKGEESSAAIDKALCLAIDIVNHHPIETDTREFALKLAGYLSGLPGCSDQAYGQVKKLFSFTE